MATDPLPATLSFLTNAAHLLALASPETSAHLMVERNSLMFNNHLDQPDVQRQHICGCCGHIMIAGHGDLFEMNSSKTAREKRASRSKKKGKDVLRKSGCQKTLTCSNCGRYTKINLPPPARVPKHRPNQTSKPLVADTRNATLLIRSGNAPRAASPSEPVKTSANASSKKRAKNRKQGLQALLQQSSNSKPQVGLGLSLADFMQN
ncbi:hypothetical protein GGS24DRAFT_166985 [Hypoxylon argillaceum]|nr:hypothetical protein GGS24DRAFT_166985 [Hypoxylon argillaceum]